MPLPLIAVIAIAAGAGLIIGSTITYFFVSNRSNLNREKYMKQVVMVLDLLKKKAIRLLVGMPKRALTSSFLYTYTKQRKTNETTRYPTKSVHT